MRVVLQAHSRQPVPRTVRLCGVARHSYPQDEHTQKTPILEPNVVVSGVRFLYEWDAIPRPLLGSAGRGWSRRSPVGPRSRGIRSGGRPWRRPRSATRARPGTTTRLRDPTSVAPSLVSMFRCGWGARWPPPPGRSPQGCCSRWRAALCSTGTAFHGAHGLRWWSATRAPPGTATTPAGSTQPGEVLGPAARCDSCATGPATTPLHATTLPPTSTLIASCQRCPFTALSGGSRAIRWASGGWVAISRLCQCHRL